MSVFLQVSVAEALDKLTILEIKKEKINDDRKLHVEKEYDYLLQQLNEYVKKYNNYYKILKKTNLEIWNLQDEIRGVGKIPEGIVEIILNLNDSRFLIKNKINILSNSNFLEQKGYNKRNLFINLSNTNLSEKIDEITEYSLFYDNVFLFVDCEINLELSDPTIHIQTLDKYCEDSCDFINYKTGNSKISHSYFKK